MGIIKLETTINSTAEICFDLSRSVELHIASTQKTKEQAIDGITSGLMSLGDTVTWKAKHFGFFQKLKVKISKFDRPNHFQDKQVEGIFKNFTHDHYFLEQKNYIIMKDVFEFQCPYGLIGRIVDPIIHNHLKEFLIERNTLIKSLAEGNDWAKFTDLKS